MRVNAERARGAKFMRGLKGRLASALRGGELCFRQLSSGFQRIFAAGGVSIENAANLIADITKDSKNFFFGALGFGGIEESPVMALKLAGEGRAGLIGIATDGDHCVDRFIEEFVEVFGTVMGNVDPDLGHDFDGEWMDVTGGF